MNKVAVIGIVGNSVFLPVEKFHVGGETIEAKSVTFELGGKGFNQAVAAKRWGAEVSFLAAAGEDGAENIEKFLRNEGINAAIVKKREATAFAAIVTDSAGANRVTVYQGAQLSAADVEERFETEIRTADVLLLNNEVAEEVNLAAAKIAKKYDVKIVLNPAPQRETAKELLNAVYLFTPNEHEAAGLEEYKNVIQTLGGKGAYIRSENRIVPPEKVKAIDTTGAGDTFSGVLCAEIAGGAALNEAVKAAVKASGKSVTKKGAVSSIPFKNEIN